jgi:hypothetical protein
MNAILEKTAFCLAGIDETKLRKFMAHIPKPIRIHMLLKSLLLPTSKWLC